MPSTFLSLTNKLLRKFNEVELTEGEFASARGVRSHAKDCVKNAIDEINQQTFDWPFNAFEENTTLVAGQTEYSWPSGFKVVDWKSFVVLESDTYGNSNTQLKKINRDYWYDRLRDADLSAGSDGTGVPAYVFPGHGTGFGVSPSPNNPYPLSFRYYKIPTELTLHDDQTTIPSQYDNVIIVGASYYMYMFRGNVEAANSELSKFKDLLNNMRNNLLVYYETVRDTRVNF